MSDISTKNSKSGDTTLYTTYNSIEENTAELSEHENKYFASKIYPQYFSTWTIFQVAMGTLTLIIPLWMIATSEHYFDNTRITGSVSEANIQTPTGAKPNFVFLLADDLGWNAIGYQDFDLDFTTPTLKKLAKTGIIMENYYGQEMCTPSRASLLTGRYPIHLGMQFTEVEVASPWGLNLTETTLPEVLRENGYTTYAFGKWNLGHSSPRYLPTARGFDYFLGYLTGQLYYWSKKPPGYNTFHDFLYSNQDCYAGYNGTDLHTYSTFLFRDKAVDAIKYHEYDKTPLFLYLAFQAVHDPFYDVKDNFADGIPPDYFEEVKQLITFISIGYHDPDGYFYISWLP